MRYDEEGTPDNSWRQTLHMATRDADVRDLELTEPDETVDDDDNFCTDCGAELDVDGICEECENEDD